MVIGSLLQLALETLIKVLLPVIMGYIVVWINQKISESKSKTRSTNMTYVIDLVYRLVLAAEQNGMIGAIKNAGEEKKKFVLAQAQAELEKHGISMDLETLDSLVEAAVNEAFGKVEFDIHDFDPYAPQAPQA